MKPQIFRTHKEILGAFAHCIVRQSPKIEDISPALRELKTVLSDRKDPLDVAEFKDENDLQEFIKSAVFGIKPIADLNICEAERRGEKVPQYSFVSRDTELKPDYDFVDLDALRQNIFHLLA